MPQTQSITQLIKSLTIFEIVLTLVLSVAIGVCFWGWTFVYEIFKPFLKVFGLSYLAAGFWLFSSLLVSYIIQKPLVGLVAGITAAFVQGILTHWGPMSIIWGFVQGIGAELVFMLFLYRRWNIFILILAAIVSCIFSYALDYYIYDYNNLNLTFNLIQISGFILSSIFLAGILSYLTVKRLLRLGVLEQFKVAK